MYRRNSQSRFDHHDVEQSQMPIGLEGSCDGLMDPAPVDNFLRVRKLCIPQGANVLVGCLFSSCPVCTLAICPHQMSCCKCIQPDEFSEISKFTSVRSGLTMDRWEENREIVLPGPGTRLPRKLCQFEDFAVTRNYTFHLDCTLYKSSLQRSPATLDREQ